MTFQTLLRASALAVVTALPMAAVAQTETDEGAAAAETLPVGRPAEEIGATYVAETHGAWEIRCIRQEEGSPEPCQLYQLMSDEAGNPVAEMNIFDLPDEGQIVAGATVVTPLDTLLPPGMRLRVDDGQWAEYPYAFCQSVGCFSRLGLTQADLDAFRAGGDAYVAMVPLPAPDQVVQLQASLIGFTAGFEALAERTSAALEMLETNGAGASE